MNESHFVAYVGPPELHDGQVLTVVQNGDRVSVLVQSGGERRFAVDFEGVTDIRAIQPEGMTLYALVEMTAPSPLRRFVFANWDDEDASALEVIAREFQVSDHAPSPSPGQHAP